MLKGIAVFGVALAILCANGRAEKVADRQSNQHPPTPVPAISAQKQDAAALNPKGQQNVHADVKIIDSPKKDFYDKAPVWIDFALVFIALGTGIVIGWQSWETRKAAGAAKTSGDAFVEAERAWMFVESGNIPDDFEPNPTKIEILEIMPVISNRGRTAGRITQGFVAQTQLVGSQALPPEPNYSGNMSGPVDVDIVLPPEAAVQALQVKISLADFIPIRLGQRKLYIYGFVKYQVMGNNERETRFCFEYVVPGGFTSQKRGFYSAINVPKAYTRST